MTKAIDVACIGGGPAGLMAAEAAVAAGAKVFVFDAMPSIGRKFLVAGKGGLNLTFNEPLPALIARYGESSNPLAPLLESFGPDQIRSWAHGLGINTVVGSSSRIFPSDYKAAPLLRAWRARLRRSGVEFVMRHRWLGWSASGELRFETDTGERIVGAAATVFALGGGSWSKLGSNGRWVEVFRADRIQVRELMPSNCGFEIEWSAYLKEKFAGTPLKSIAATAQRDDGSWSAVHGECVISAYGIEGGVIYALSPILRQQCARQGQATLLLDLKPSHSLSSLCAVLSNPRGSRTLATHLKRQANITGGAAVLLREVTSEAQRQSATDLAQIIKNLPLTLQRSRPLDEAISSAGGVAWSAVDNHLMLRNRPGVFIAGEMLDWEAPTGGYLLTGCLATGRAAGNAAATWANQSRGQ